VSNPTGDVPGNPYNESTPAGPAGGGIPSYGAYAGQGGFNNDPNQLIPGSDRPGAGRRFAGFLIDSILIGIVGGVIGSLAGIDITGGVGATFLFSLITIILWFIVRVGSEVAWGGSPGKRILGMKVVGPTGERLDAQASLKRNAWYAAGIIPAVGGLVQLGLGIWIGVGISGDPQKRSYFDKFSDAAVVRSK